MRCIEIPACECTDWEEEWLTLTWDILKFAQIEVAYQNTVRLTLTWDVLK